MPKNYPLDIEVMNTREQTGREMAAQLKIVRKENKWIIPSV